MEYVIGGVFSCSVNSCNFGVLVGGGMLRVFLLYRFDSTSAHNDFKPAIITMVHEVKENRQPINAIIISAEKLK